MFNNIYEIMEHMHDVNIEVNTRIEYSAMQFIITEGVGDAISSVINFIKNLIASFINLVKKIISSITGLFKGGSGDSSGGGGGSSSNNNDGETNTVKVKNESGKKFANVTEDGLIYVYDGLFQTELIYRLFTEMWTEMCSMRDFVDEGHARENTSKKELNQTYLKVIAGKEIDSIDELYNIVRDKLKLNDKYLTLVNLDDNDIKNFDIFIDRTSDKLIDRMEKLTKSEQDHADKMIREIKRENEYDRVKVDSLSCFMSVSSKLLQTFNKIIKDYYRYIARIKSTYNASKK